MTGEAAADPMLDYTRDTEAQVTQDTPAQTGTPARTEIQDKGIHRAATKLKADHPTDSGQVTIDHLLRMPGIILGVDHLHAMMTGHIDVV